jgi:DNA-binding response OmpR family regulator
MAKKILVIDDELPLRQLVKLNLTASGYEVRTATTGQEGLKLAEQEKPHLILLDIRIPDMSGWEVLIALKTNRKLEKVPVVIMTASPPTQEDEEIRALRADGLLNKPFSVEELLQQVKTALGEK